MIVFAQRLLCLDHQMLLGVTDLHDQPASGADPDEKRAHAPLASAMWRLTTVVSLIIKS